MKYTRHYSYSNLGTFIFGHPVFLCMCLCVFSFLSFSQIYYFDFTVLFFKKVIEHDMNGFSPIFRM